MKSESYVVYVHTTPDGKRYVGITKQSPDRRWRGGEGYRKNVHFFRAILKYGWDNIRHEIIAEGVPKAEASAKEKELIAKWRTNDYRYGYNNTEGGEYGYSLTAESREKVSAKLKDLYKDKTKHPMYGHKATEETRRKISESRMNNKWSVRKSIQQYDLQGVLLAEYETITAAHNATGISMSSLSQCAHGVPGHATAGHYIWRFKC